VDCAAHRAMAGKRFTRVQRAEEWELGQALTTTGVWATDGANVWGVQAVVVLASEQVERELQCARDGRQ
jgi:hypothetical protein